MNTLILIRCRDRLKTSLATPWREQVRCPYILRKTMKKKRMCKTLVPFHARCQLTPKFDFCELFALAFCRQLKLAELDGYRHRRRMTSGYPCTCSSTAVFTGRTCWSSALLSCHRLQDLCASIVSPRRSRIQRLHIPATRYVYRGWFQ